MDYVEQFTAIIEKWKSAYAWATYSYVGVNINNCGSVLNGRVVLEPFRPTINSESFKFETEHFFAGRFFKELSVEEVLAVISKASAGAMDTLNGGNSLATENGRLDSYLQFEEHPVIAKLRMSAASKHHLLYNSGLPRQHDWQLKCADKPFDSLDELYTVCDLPGPSLGNDTTTIEVFAKSPGELLNDSKILGRQGKICCRVAKGLRPEKIKLGYQYRDERLNTKREAVVGTAIKWRDEGDAKIGEYQIDGVGASVFQAYLSYEGVPLHQRSISDPDKLLNPRLAVHRVVDSDLELLREAVLRPNKNNKSDAFEGGVSALLTLLGFSITNYGIMHLFRDGPDIVAYTPDGNLAVVECTIDVLNHKDKLSKLVQRTKLVKDQLAKTGYSHAHVESIIVTLLTRGEVKADLPAAGKLGVVVLARENLEAALKQIELPHDAESYLRGLKRLIPSDGSPYQTLLGNVGQELS